MFDYKVVTIIIIMKYLLSANLQYIPELGALYTKQNKRKEKKEKKARTVQQQKKAHPWAEF